MTALLVAGVIGFLASAALIALALRSAHLRAWLADRPNERSLHTRITPRFGGLGLLAGAALALAPHLLTGAPDRAWVAAWLGLCAVLATLSAVDDRRPLSPLLRLAMQLGVAAVWIALLTRQGTDTAFGWSGPAGWAPVGWEGPLSWLVLGLGVVGLTWCMNLYNFMDGADGLAGSMAVIGFGAYAVAAWCGAAQLSPDLQPAGAAIGWVALALAGAAGGFLVHNFPPARVFMGDAGSIPLGFSAGALGLLGVSIGLWSPLWPLIVFFPFVFDASLTLARRLLRGEAIWRPHREHLYQRHVLGGRTHRQMLGKALALMVISATLALMVVPGVAPFSRNFAIRIETLIIALQIVAGVLIARRIGR